MQSGQTAPQNIDEYIARFPPEVREILERIRLTIKKAAPEAQEAIRYQMPTWRLNGNLVHFAAYKGHIGFYPTPSGMEKFKEELSPYPGGKGSVRFSLASPIPYALIRKIVQYRVQESKGRPATKRMGKSRAIKNRRIIVFA